MNTLRVLIIEDHESWQTRLGNLVPQLGHVDLDIAADFEVASKQITTRKYDIAIVDLLLASGSSEVGGDALANLELLKTIRNSKYNRSCALIVLTGYGNTDRTRQALLEYDAYDFIEKDRFQAGDFLLTVGAALFDARLKLAMRRKASRYNLDTTICWVVS